MKTERIDIRISPELKEQIRQAAERENRSISNFIEAIIKRELDSSDE